MGNHAAVSSVLKAGTVQTGQEQCVTALCNDADYLPAPWNFCRQSLCVLLRFSLGHMQSNISI